jgi:DNA integrity scanning protein DisA with diadenylate cyclase activity
MSDLLDRFSLLDFCDILILAVFIYHFALLLKKDVATRLLLILLLFLSTLIVFRFTSFTVTTWLLNSLFSSTLIILAVIFQADIRRASLSMGRRQIEPHVRDEEAEMIEELIKAASEMAEKRIGALIVIVRHLPIDHLLEIGTQIEAKVSSELLNSIFLPYSPIHDGAVIINRG